MNLLYELENQFKIKSKTESIQEKEKIAVDFLCTVDFTDPINKSQAEQYIKHILNDFVGKNQEITSLEAKIIHCMITKISLDNLGLQDVKINYVSKDGQNTNAGAYYRDSDNSVNFFNESVCNKQEWLLPYGSKDNIEKGVLSRLDYLTQEIFKLEHEIQHAVQFKNMFVSENKVDLLTPESYIISRQYVARLFAKAEGTKYYKHGLNIDRLYYDNHDQFFYEIDADKYGYERTLNILKTISPKAYQIAIDEHRNGYETKLKNKTEQLKNYSAVTWKHNTNPELLEVSANHKSSMIIDNVLPRLNGKQRKEFMDKYPSLLVTYNPNGTLKSLEQVEREKQSKIDELLINGTDKEIQEKAINISKVYDSAIESHPVLCFEKCLQHIARLSWNSDRYFTDSGIEVKYNPNQIRKELKLAEEKAKLIASYMEDTDAKQLKLIFDKYKKEVMTNSKLDRTSIRFFEDKKLAVLGIENQINLNREVKLVIDNDIKEISKKRIQKQLQKKQSEEIIRKVFPKFNPNPQTGVLKDGSVELFNNVNERMMLLEAYKQYIRTIASNNSINKEDVNYVESSSLLLAINTLYNFTPTKEEKSHFYEALQNGEINIIKNKYEKTQNVDIQNEQKTEIKQQSDSVYQNANNNINNIELNR